MSFFRGLSTTTQRTYFYIIDCRGRLFLDGTKNQNYATSLRNKIFLNFFYKQLRADNNHIHPEFPYVSPCGKELNFVRCEDITAATAFSELVKGSGENSFNSFSLRIGASDLMQTFDPNKLRISRENGHLYHLLSDHRHLRKSNSKGVLHPEITQQLSHQLRPTDQGFLLSWFGAEYHIRTE